MKIKRLPGSVWHAVQKFFKAIDENVTLNAYGQPLLAQWEGVDPYASYINNDKRAEVLCSGKKKAGSLMFIKGRNPLETVHLPVDSRVTLGASCSNNIVVLTKDDKETKMFIQINPEGEVYFRTEDARELIKINNHEVTEGAVYDQDSIEFCGCEFIFNRFE